MKIGIIASVAMAVLGALSAVVMIAKANDHELEDQINQIRNDLTHYNNKKMYSEAADCYEKLIALDSNNYDLIIEYREYSKERNFELNEARACVMAMNLRSDDFESAKIYLNYLINTNAKMSDIYSFVKGRISILEGEGKQYFSDYYDSIKGLYKKLRSKYSYVGSWHNNYILLSNDNSYSLMSGQEIYAAGKTMAEDNEVNIFLNAIGSVAAGTAIEGAVSYSFDDNLVAGINDGQLVYMDLSGRRKIVPYDASEPSLIEYSYLGPYSGGMANFCDKDDWGYINKGASVVIDGFEYASPLSNGVAAVKKDGKYAFVKYTSSDGFVNLTDYVYDDIFLDESGYAFSYGYTYVKENGSGWKLAKLALNEEKTQIAGIHVFDGREYEDVKQFGIYGAVKKDGKWGFIDYNNNWLIEPAYKDAKSFVCGLAPVVEDTLWGYIDTKGKMIIEAQFMEANEFNQSGVAAVNNLNEWYFIQLTEYAE